MRKLSIGEKMFLACYNLLLKEVHKVSCPVSENALLESFSGDDENGVKELYRKRYEDMREEQQDTPSLSSFRIWGY
jgi:hypothetical protein